MRKKLTVNRFRQRLLSVSVKVAMYASSIVMALGISAAPAAAATSLQPAPRISFTFDDGYSSALTEAAPALAAHGYTGTEYVTTSFVGLDEYYLTWQQITALQNNYGWEIGSHTVTHPALTEVTATQLETELAGSKQALASHGINATSFATPYGDYNNQVMAAAGKHYASHRPFWDQQYINSWPYSDYLLYVKQVQIGVSVAQVKSYIDEAKQNNAWLVLVFHDIADTPDSNPEEYEYATADLSAIAAYAQSQGLANVNVNQGLVSGNANLLSNATFDNGIAAGWTTSAPAFVQQNTASRGSHPSPTNSIEFTASPSQNVHLFSPMATVDSSKSYLFKTFLNIENITNGEIFFYVDEYDASGNWISGQYKVGATEAFVESINIPYQPSSASVKKASLQIGASAGSNAHAYVDNVRFFPTD